MKTKLVHEIRQGLLVVRIRRANKNGDLWHESTRLGRDDLPFVRFLLDEAHTWMIQQESEIALGREEDE